MPYIIIKRKSGTVDMQLIDSNKSFYCNGFCNRSFTSGPKVFVTYNFYDGNKNERILCISCAKAGVEDADKYGYVIGNYDKQIDAVS